MALGGSPLILIPALFSRKASQWVKDHQIRGYLKCLLVFAVLFILWQKGSLPVLDSLFIAVSANSTTGFFAGIPRDGFMTSLLLLASYIGGCSGSTLAE